MAPSVSSTSSSTSTSSNSGSGSGSGSGLRLRLQLESHVQLQLRVPQLQLEYPLPLIFSMPLAIINPHQGEGRVMKTGVVLVVVVGGSRGLTTEEDKWRLHVDILTYTVASHCMSGLVKVVGAECDAVALWGLPGKHLDSWWTQLRSGMWRMYFQLSPEGRKRYFDEIVPPPARRQSPGPSADRENDAWIPGLSRHQAQLRRAADTLPKLLAGYDGAGSQANNAYYEKFGFEVKQDVFLERGPVPVRLSIMARKKKFVVGAAKGLRRGLIE
ncbi:hypothetical protein CHGG_04640 [Chaetomium globosum CBS 148.51]|uniref:N-acetyltransferase domain-containing protein n=1 Tax=Chaetomium globosum (strain ATCC 6205 / CBS 148.51 / DSM 1962 / NBRC 6347 / NRRL 1970) TaxID=306901 RepID=Q2H0Q6_CHAGB|nr:uncharacterized protein CHGG_04640 [Chaetomium globosum CBS 148.51]EAQ88021.1 hypothetical protein CHGG_04640 [Chaetomium globosum CBS 148.51]